MRYSVRVARVDVFDSRVDLWYAPSGTVWQHARKVSRRVARYARREAPKRGGFLRRSIRAHTSRRGRRHVVGFAQAHSGHAYWVHEGTGPQRTPRKMTGLSPRRSSAGYWRPGMRKPWPKMVTGKGFIHGQDSNPYLVRGMQRASMDFPGGMLPPVLRSRSRGLR